MFSFVTLYFIVFVSVFVLISSVGICLFGAMDQAASSAISISDWQLIRRRSRLVSTAFLFNIIITSSSLLRHHHHHHHHYHHHQSGCCSHHQ